MPVATRIRISRRGMPAASSVSRIGGSKHAIGHRAGHVANDHAGIAASAGQFPQRRRSGRLRQTLPHRGVRIGQRLGRPILKAADHVAVGQLDVQARPAVFQVDSHRSYCAAEATALLGSSSGESQRRQTHILARTHVRRQRSLTRILPRRRAFVNGRAYSVVPSPTVASVLATHDSGTYNCRPNGPSRRQP